MNNKHAQEIPVDVLAEAKTKISEVIAALSPYTVTLTPAERHELPKMGEKTYSFVSKAHELALQNPQFCPQFLDMDAFAIDFNDAERLRSLLNLAQQLESAIDDTQMASGSEAYQAALIFYNAVKQASSQSVLGAKEVYDELRKRYPGFKRKPAEE